MKDDRITIAPDYLDDWGELDLTKQIQDLQLKVDTYEELMGDTKKLKWEVKKLESEIIKKDNLIQGMKQIITDLSEKKWEYKIYNNF